MTSVRILTLLELCNYALLLLFGLLLSIEISGKRNILRQQPLSILLLFLSLYALQGVVYFTLGENQTWRLYPLITHLPLVCILIFVLKRTVRVACVIVATAY